MKRFIKNIIVLFLLTNLCHAQNRYINWYFGYGAGLSFSSSGPKTITGGKTATLEGVATMSDPCGNLLFYSDGRNIYNKNHQIMSNGSGIFGHIQSAEAVINVPKPLSDSLYYVFTVYSYANDTGLQYHIVDMSKKGGDGQVISKNNKIYSKTSEKICAVLHQNKKDYWILTHDWYNNHFKVFLLTDKGLNTSPIISILGPTTNNSVENAIGHLRPSSDGKFVVSTFWYQGILEIYNFDNSTGKMNLKTKLTNFDHNRCYSIEFSPNNKLLYVGEAGVGSYNDVYQYNLTVSNIANSRYKFTTQNLRFGDFVMGPDGKFYIAKYKQNYLDVINNPDSIGAKANYTINGFSLGSQTSQLGLNNVIHPISISKPEFDIIVNAACDLKTPVKFEMVSNSCYDSLIWNFADTGNFNQSRNKKTYHTYSKKGRYNITLTVYHKGITYNIKKNIKVPNTPEINLGIDTFICGNFSIKLDGADTAQFYLWNDFSTSKTKTVTAAGKYWVKSTLNDCSAYDTILISNSTIITTFDINNIKTHCLKNNYFNFKNTSKFIKDSLKTLIWKFSDNTSYSSDSLIKSFSVADSFEVKLIIHTKNNCIDSISKSIIVNPQTVIDFDINSSTQCFVGHNFEFINKTTVSKGSYNSIWDLGDGSFSASKNIYSKKYSKDTIYKITLITTTDKGCNDTFSKSISFFVNPKSDFDINKVYQCFKDNSYNFTDKSTIEKGFILKNYWMLGDNDMQFKKDIISKHYNSEDSFKVVLVNISNNSCRDSISKWVYIQSTPNTAFSTNLDTQCFKKHAFDFLNKTTIKSGSYTTIWHLGDNTASTSKDVIQKKYSKTGEFNVLLICTSNNNCIDSFNKKIIINESPASNFNIDDDRQCLNRNNFNFTSTSSIANGKLKYFWILNDNNTSDSANIYNYKFNTEDTFKISLISISDKNCKDTQSKNAIILPQPIANVIIPNDSLCWYDNYFLFTNNTIIKYGTINHFWDFGDGTTDNVRTPVNKKFPNKTAKYLIKYKAISDNGCTDSSFKNIVIKAKPKALFSYTQLLSFDDIKLQLNNESSNDVVINNWDMGDGIKSNEKHPIVSYNDTGKYSITLIVENDVGCLDTFMQKANYFYPNYYFYLPNSFSPNNNGLNEVFKPISSKYYRKYLMEIYNSWGEKIFETNNLIDGWNGKYMDKDCPDGVYHCFIRILPMQGSLKSYNTNIHLLR
ncbi:MAG: gliding motility-associated C-terminal domain-containing protein [Bacteroidetes bacterium]|nr:gliding motility-associated C-terminal domain-containing protein [Bacteroidota bacterium]